ncbi:MAG: hypothetical protein M3Z25_00795 [Actinomycetota bacterium]|nr:hypothetical protein [Actinomycetota bacterium]
MTTQAGGIDSHAGGRTRAMVEVVGVLDRAQIARLRRELARWRQAGVEQLVVDVSRMPVCAPGLARMLAWASLQLRDSGTAMIITGAGERVRAELAAEVAALDMLTNARGAQPSAQTYRPETADQP